MNLKKVLLGIAVIGASSLAFAFSQHTFQQIEGLAQKTYLVQNLISFEQASAIIKEKSQGTVIYSVLETGEGAPHYEYIILEQQQTRMIRIHAELGKVLVDKSVSIAMPITLYTPTVTLADAIATAELDLIADIVAAELDQYPLHAVYRLIAMSNQVIFEVTVSADTGKLLTIERMEEEWPTVVNNSIDSPRNYFKSSTTENSYITSRQAIAKAEAVIGGRVISMEWEFDEQSQSKHHSAGIIWVELQDQDNSTAVAIDVLTGEVLETDSDSNKALTDSLTQVEGLASLSQVIAKAKAAHSGILLGIGLEEEDAQLVYYSLFRNEDKLHLVASNALDASVLFIQEIEDVEEFEEDLNRYSDALTKRFDDSL